MDVLNIPVSSQNQTLGLLLHVLVLALSKEAELGDADNCLLPGSGFNTVSAAILHSGTSNVATSCAIVVVSVVVSVVLQWVKLGSWTANVSNLI